jgi:uncharacterized membrane protein YhaH (DUF805 family)
MIDEDALKSVEKLHQMKADGIISDEEFERSKERLLFGVKQPNATSSRSLHGEAAMLPADNDFLAWAILPLKRYADFSGRSCRQEFWSFLGLSVAVALVGGVMVAIDEYGALGKLGALLIAVMLLGTLVPSFAVMARRYHDQDKSGWYVLLNLIPYVGTVIVLLTMLIPGTAGENQFGHDPKGS